MEIRRGTRPIQARKPRSNFGNDRIRRREEKRANKKSLR
jgi:hypothetical protein